MVYVVSFTLAAPELPESPFTTGFGAYQPRYDTVAKAIQSHDVWARIRTDFWLVSSTTLTAAALRDNIWSAMQQGDVLFVAHLTGEWGAYNLSKEVLAWLEQVNL